MRILESPKSSRFSPTFVRDRKESFTNSCTTVSIPEKMSSSISSRNFREACDTSRPSVWIRNTSSTRYVPCRSTRMGCWSFISYLFSSK